MPRVRPVIQSALRILRPRSTLADALGKKGATPPGYGNTEATSRWSQATELAQAGLPQIPATRPKNQHS